jgi:hypothetical protein
MSSIPIPSPRSGILFQRLVDHLNLNVSTIFFNKLAKDFICIVNLFDFILIENETVYRPGGDIAAALLTV